MTSTTPTPTKGSANLTLPNDTDIQVVREFAAPAAAVWRVFTEPELIAQWWAGQHGTVTSVEIDARPGGTYRYAMQANEGFEVAFHGEFTQVVPTERLVHTEVFEGMPDGESAATLNTYVFVEHDGRTTLTLVTRAPSKEVRDAIVSSGMESGLQEGFDLVDELAAGLA
ncbi:SRPBCC family protein [Isoptericola sp. NEAU-Y5]|uniref:SRPBCC family protein n=1 Tax=Isoptericola luteus TaxID=2879484 RepID=A0ABS7ZFC8_9MICO|nr:SRPBCC family protein [Isoptericola sp. NEAU-Y5]MCA5893732.1 SRPBCC family protein [Isoptericola sp. NEAU-Y5]